VVFARHQLDVRLTPRRRQATDDRSPDPSKRCAMDRESFYKSCRTRLCEFAEGKGSLAEHRGLIEDCTDEDNLFVLGLVDSMDAVGLVELVEECFGIEIPLDDYDPASFYSMGAMFESFGLTAQGQTELNAAG
jgi:acyl carrier protein